LEGNISSGKSTFLKEVLSRSSGIRVRTSNTSLII